MKIFGFLRGKSATVKVGDLEQMASGAWAYGVSSPEKALQVSAVLCAVRVIAEGMAQMPLAIRRREMRGGRIYTPDAVGTPVWKVFNRAPNTFQSPYEFVEHAVFCAALTGEFLAYRVRDARGALVELLPVVPGAWTVERVRGGDLVYRVTLQDGGVATWGQEDVFHLRGPAFMEAYRGLSPVKLAAKAVGLASAIEGQQERLASKGGRPSGLLSTPLELGSDARDRIIKAWNAAFGENGGGGVAMLDGGMGFTPMAMSSVDAQVIETRRYQIEEIARIFRVFPTMLMQSDKASTFASAESFFRAHVRHTLGPWMGRFEGAINSQLLSRSPDLFADFDERQLLRGDLRDQGTYYQAALGGSGAPAWMTQNEVRADIGEEPIDDPEADKLFGPRGAEQTEPAAPPASPEGGADDGT